MAKGDEIPRKPTRILAAGEIEREIAGIRAGLELCGVPFAVPFTAEAEVVARAVLNGEITGDEAIARGLADLNARTAQ